eukprot:COSAG01_NODE_4719_length_4794_cov_4.909478_2_plen_104_part_00
MGGGLALQQSTDFKWCTRNLDIGHVVSMNGEDIIPEPLRVALSSSLRVKTIQGCSCACPPIHESPLADVHLQVLIILTLVALRLRCETLALVLLRTAGLDLLS